MKVAYPDRGTPAFEKARRAVARELGWKVENVMDWEVRSYLDRRVKIAAGQGLQ